MLKMQHARVIVLDDHALMCKTIERFCRYLKFPCTTFTEWSGGVLHALEDCIFILDLKLSDMDGIDVLHHIAETKYRPTIVFCSGMDEQVLQSAQAVAQSIGLTVAGTLHKPFSLEDFSNKITNAQAMQVKPSFVPLQKVGKKQAFTQQDAIAALANDQFYVVYHPQIDIRTAELVGLECLSRLKTENGVIPPYEFIPVIEKAALIDEFTLHQFEKAILGLPQQLRSRTDICISFNFSAYSLTSEFVTAFIEKTKSLGITPASIVIEITESSEIDIKGAALDLLTKLKIQGFSISLDDFGTGYSTVTQLKELPFDEMKIDKSFVDGIGINERAEALVDTTINLAHQLDFRLVAEGVETFAQLAYLNAKGCYVFQGYFLSRELDSEALSSFDEKLNSASRSISSHFFNKISLASVMRYMEKVVAVFPDPTTCPTLLRALNTTCIAFNKLNSVSLKQFEFAIVPRNAQQIVDQLGIDYPDLRTILLNTESSDISLFDIPRFKRHSGSDRSIYYWQLVEYLIVLSDSESDSIFSQTVSDLEPVDYVNLFKTYEKTRALKLSSQLHQAIRDFYARYGLSPNIVFNHEFSASADTTTNELLNNNDAFKLTSQNITVFFDESSLHLVNKARLTKLTKALLELCEGSLSLFVNTAKDATLFEQLHTQIGQLKAELGMVTNKNNDGFAILPEEVLDRITQNVCIIEAICEQKDETLNEHTQSIQ